MSFNREIFNEVNDYVSNLSDNVTFEPAMVIDNEKKVVDPGINIIVNDEVIFISMHDLRDMADAAQQLVLEQMNS